jgi:hypothetical protein
MKPVNILLVSLGEAAIALYLLPPISPRGTFATYITIFLTLNFGIYAIYNLFVYPFFLSPLRHLPQPHTRGWPILGHGT